MVRLYCRPCLAADSRLPDGLKLRDAILYHECSHIGVMLAPSDILVSVLLGTLESTTICAYPLVGDTHLVVALDLPSARNTSLSKDLNPFAVGTVVFDGRNSPNGAPERFV